ncbi:MULTISPECIES: Hsp20/alpha crystallin family protein [Halomicrobium]|uniref:Heat shock protein Hsp20 n=2 Tax=Halomicrobium mukohataei TaxID=57705 RepID=C7P3P9_HALMD|nr:MULTISPECIES: Hsp20/alpha crystallin family protein [Halomicrobium]ACV47721.1 heat shock protein Hsp20 [Halomicrobium mukohataei DSM 12286]QCD66174.1 Hsp20/alpha crystallin family protein [Halomicrobium mukohataei]QFR20979.1 Hsp20 family protein [Halomicrobium sp. ZPS1]
MSALRDALGDLPASVFADVLESDDAYLLVVDLPGVTADTIDVSVDGGSIVIEAQRGKDVGSEFRYVEEDRSLFLDAELPLPPDATGTGAEGTIDRGVFELRLPKAGVGTETTIPVEDA